MTKKTYTQKDNTVWEWEETKEFVEALKNYFNIVNQNKQKN